MTETPALSDARRQLLEKLRRGELQVAKVAVDPLVPLPLGAETVLAPDLEHLWLHERLCGAPINNESFTIHRHGPLDAAVLARCFDEITRRHEIWRTAFPIVNGAVIQQVRSHVPVDLPFFDLRHLTDIEREAESLRIATQDAGRPFDLDTAPLFRLSLVQCSDDDHRIYLTVHRLVFDCPAIERVLVSELAALYGAFSAGRPSPLPDLAFQHRDYAAWKHRRLADSSHAAQMEYWRQNLPGDLAALELRTDRPRPVERTWRSEMETWNVPAQLHDALQDFSVREGVTPYMVLLTAFQLLLYRNSGQNEIVVGGKTNSRTRPEFEPLLGSFVNTIVFRTHIEPGLSFRDFLGRVKHNVLGALANSDLPFDAIVREMAPQRTSNRHPLFQVLFSMRALFGGFPDGWDLSDMEVHSGASGFDLFVEFAEHTHGMIGRFVYSTDLFDRAGMLRRIGQFQALLAEMLDHPDRAVSVAQASDCAPTGHGTPHALPASEAGPRTQGEFVAPENDIEERLANIWQMILGVPAVSVTDNYFDIGGHSYLALRLFSEIKFCFNIDLPLGTLLYAPTIRDLAAAIRAAGVEPAPPLIPIQPQGTKPPVYCIGPVNGELILYRPLALELGLDQPMFGLQPFSLQDRISSVEGLAAGYIEQLQLSGRERPFCILGYSFGGLVAVEMAHQLRMRGSQPPLVVLIDANYPAGCKTLENRIRRYRYHFERIVNRARGLTHLGEGLRRKCSRLMHRVSRKAGVSAARITSDISGQQVTAAENWRAKAYPGLVWLLRAASGFEFLVADASLGWSKVLSNLRIEDVPGNHGTINTGTNLKILAQKLRAALEEAHGS